MNTVVRALYGYDGDKASVETGLVCKDRSLTIQEQADEADINVIWDRYVKTGAMPEVRMPPQFGDFETEVSDYHSALELIRAADASFMSLPATVRSEFDNDAGKFVAFASDPANMEALAKLGVKTEEGKKDG